MAGKFTAADFTERSERMEILVPDKTIKKPDVEIYGDFYNPDKPLSYGRHRIYSVGTRSIGKSTGWAIKLLLEYIRKERMWVYTRRTQDETFLTCRKWFDNAVMILNDSGYHISEFEYDGGKYIMDGKECGYVIPLSDEQKYKSSNFSMVWYLIFDEFISRNNRYLGGKGSFYEVDCMESLFQTIDRGPYKPYRDELTSVYLGNASSFYNPHFISDGIDSYLRTDTKILAPKGKQWMVELTRETEATKKIENSNAYKLSSERTRQYAFRNVTFDTGNKFIEKIKDAKEPLFNIIYENITYGVWCSHARGILYVSRKPVLSNINIAATTTDHRPNYLMVRRMSKNPYTKMLQECYESGDVRFETGKCKYAIDNYMMYMIQ